MFLSAHYGGEDLVLKLKPDEAWKKVFGPIFIYLNSVSDGEDPFSLWEDAKKQVCILKLRLTDIYIILIFRWTSTDLNLNCSSDDD